MSSNETAAIGDIGGGGPGGVGGGGAGGPGGPTGPKPDEVLVFWLNIGLLGAVGVLFLAFLPRAIGRFCNFTEWTRGLLLRTGSNPGPMSQPNGTHYRNDSTYSFGEVSSDHSSTLADHNPYGPSGKEWSSLPSGRGNVVHPTHVRSFATVMHPLSKFFIHPMAPNQTSGKFFLTLGYIVAVSVIAFKDAPGPLPDPNRLGYIAISQIPVVVALAAKNNAIGMLLGKGYERVSV